MKRTVCILFALLMCFALVFTGCNSSSNTGGSVSQADGDNNEVIAVNEELGYESDNEIVEQETTYEAELGEEIELFISSNYYLEGTMYSTGEAGYPMTLATDGTNIQLSTSVENISIGFLLLDDVTYIIQPTTSEYTELNSAFLSAMGMDDINLDEFKSLDTSEDTINEAIETQTKVLINGEEGLCTTFTYTDTTIKLYTVDQKLVQVNYYDETDTLTTQLVISSISATIPADQLTLKGMTEVSVYTFIKSMTSSISS
ncbi:MAG: hypothetical protein LUH40_08950 [Clostridiales bacterium]|nr:hypothetical protein [Clostridiales bacterium]